MVLKAGLLCIFFVLHTPGIEAESQRETGFKQILSKADTLTQAAEAQNVIKRLLPSRNSEFLIEVNQTMTGSRYQDAFEITWEESLQKVVIRGTTGVSALFGFNHYLKYYCQCLVTWEENQLDLPQSLPQVKLKLKILDRFRYYQNVCTESYSFAWWDWAAWEKHIDWMALNGINLPLAFTGQEAIWRDVYLELGLSKEDVDDYISGPAFLAWWRMGNIQKWGGPLPSSYADKKREILHQIVQRMRNLGMTPVLPAFSGDVPQALTKIYPNASVVQHPSWNKFNSTYSSTFLLVPTDPLFTEIGKRFVQKLVGEIGTDHIYSCDTFNENRPFSNDSDYLRNMAASTYGSMVAGDAKAVWMIQSWVFTDTDFWKKEQVKSYLSGVPVGSAIILDLEAELFPLYISHESFYNHSFIWCMLHNFGGTLGLYGSLDVVNQGIALARAGNNSLVGTGMCPEGIYQNYVMYDFMSESSLRQYPVNITEWSVQYQERRYGSKDCHPELGDAWELLTKQIYNAAPFFKFHGRSLITRRPNLKLKEPLWYNIEDIRKVLQLFVDYSENKSHIISPTSLIRYDLVDFTRQFLQVLGSKIYKSVLSYYFTENRQKFDFKTKQMLDLLDDLDVILGTNRHFMLGPWIRDAEKWGTTTDEKKLMRYNLLNQITLWGPRGEIVDYANKQWAGVVSDYYKPRWALFFDALDKSLAKGKTFNYNKFRRQVLNDVEIPFTFMVKDYPNLPQGDSIEESRRIFYKWNKAFRNYEKKGRKSQATKTSNNRRTFSALLPVVTENTNNTITQEQDQKYR